MDVVEMLQSDRWIIVLSMAAENTLAACKFQASLKSLGQKLPSRSDKVTRWAVVSDHVGASTTPFQKWFNENILKYLVIVRMAEGCTF
jgi:hypothetical protein